jgi:type IV pilus assembly protein PilW
MVAMAIALVVLAAAITVFSNTSRSRGELDRVSQQIENGRYAIDLLSQDLHLAGMYGELDVSTIAVPAALPDPCSTTVSDWASAIPIHIQGYDEGAGAPSCIPASLRANTDIFAVRRLKSCVAGVGSCAASVSGYGYMQVSLCGTEAVTSPYVIGFAGSASYNLHTKDCSTTAGVRQYVVDIYFVSNDNGAGKSIPTLKRMELSGNSWVETPLVEGVDRMEVEYGVDTNNDGAPDAYTADPTTYTYAGCTSCTAANNWSNVMTARLYLLARANDSSLGYTDSKTYSLGSDASGAAITAGPYNDAYHRHVYTALVRLTNPAERRDTP